MSRRNENRLGYRETNVGWIPKDWEVRLLDEICRRETGHTPDKNSPEFWGGPVKWVSLSDSNSLNKKYIYDTAKSITQEGLDNSSARLLPKGTVILLRDASVGKAGLLGEAMAVSQHFVAWICRDSLLNDFLYYWLTNNEKKFKRIAVGSTIVTIGMPYFAKLGLPLPSLPEQKKIAEILSTWDDAIEQTRKLIEAKKRRKKALMQQFFSAKKRSTVGKGAWKKYRLKDLLQEVSRPIDFHDEDFYDLISVRRRSEGIFYRGRVAGKDILTKLLYRTHSGDFLISKMQVIHGASALVTAQFDGLSISGSYIALRCKDLKKLNMNFFNWLSRTPRFYHLTYLSSYGVHIEKMTFNLKLFLKSEISMPEKVEEQERIADFFEAVGKEIGTLENQLAALEKQKRGLMQKLLTGEVRVKV